MKLLFGLTLSLLSTIAVSHEHEYVSELPKACYTTVDDTEFCTTDNLGNVQVFVYNAGWCGPCNTKMAELSLQYKQFEGKKVTFASLSGASFKKYSKPDKAFLEAWKAKHTIPFVVAGKFNDFGAPFSNSGGIPFTVVVDAKGNVVKQGNLGATEIVTLVKKQLKEMEQLDSVSAKDFFQGIRGKYKIEKIDGNNPYDPPNEPVKEHEAELYTSEDFPDTELVYMPYCHPNGCNDSGNFFAYADTKVRKTAKGYRLELKQNSTTFKYDWEDLGDGQYLFRNHQFEMVQGMPTVSEHLLKKKN